jgi:RNA polymerase sigma factor (sigma-70 family)
MLTQRDVVFTADKPEHPENENLLEDEELAFLAENCGCRAARQELLLRFYAWSNCLIAQLARRRGLAPADLEDAQQDAVFGIIKAIHRFDARRVREGKRPCFRSFLHRILSDRFKDFVKQLRRSKTRAAYRVPPAGASESGVKGRSPDDWADPERGSDPEAMAESNEVHVLFWEAVQNLNGAEHSLVSALLSGRRLRQISGELEISYDAAKRLRRRLRKRLGRLQALIE